MSHQHQYIPVHQSPDSLFKSLFNKYRKINIDNESNFEEIICNLIVNGVSMEQTKACSINIKEIIIDDKINFEEIIVTL